MGGVWNSGSQGGDFYLHLYDDSSVHSRFVGGRLVYIPDANYKNRSLKELEADIIRVDNELQALTARVKALENE